MKIALIGAGNLATRLGVALVAGGQSVVQVYSRTEASAAALGKTLHCPAVTSLEQVCRDADVYIVAVKDAAFSGVAASLVSGRSRALFVHTAGSLPMSVWEGVASRHGVFYPMQTFSKACLVDFHEIPIFVESNSEADTQFLKDIASALSTRVYECTSEERQSLHLAAVFACNFTNHMYALASRLLTKYNLPFEVMLPLIDETARKVHTMNPQAAQTGPAVRYDRQIIDKHLAMLADEPEMQQIYRLVSESIHKLS